MEERMDWRLLLCFWLATALPPPALTLEAVYRSNSNGQGRKFGGYRIVPKMCKDTTSTHGKATGVCMFNYECTKKNGTVVGSCMDGFLFGACCRLPDDMNMVGAPLSGYPQSSYGSTVGSTERTSPVTAAMAASVSLGGSSLAINIPADTVLLHENGSVVNEPYRPEDFEFNYRPELYLATDATTQSPITRHDTHSQKSTTWSTTESSWATNSRPWASSEGNLIQIPTLTASSQSNAESINHIISILEDPSPEPIPDNKFPSTPPTFSTWVSVDSKPTTTSKPTTPPFIVSKSPTSKPVYFSSTQFQSTQKPYTQALSSTYNPSSSQSYSGSNYHTSNKYHTSQNHISSNNYPSYTSSSSYPSSSSYTSGHVHFQTASSPSYSSPGYQTSPKPYFPPSTLPSTTYYPTPSTTAYPSHSSTNYYPSSNSGGYPTSSTSHYTSTSNYVPIKQETTYTKKPASVTYSTHSKPSYLTTKKPSTATHFVHGPSFQVSITPKPHLSSTPEPPPTVIVLGPIPTKKPIPQTTRPPPVGTIITVNTDGHIVTYKPTPPTPKPVYHLPSLTVHPEITTHSTSSYYDPIHSYTSPTQVIKDNLSNSTEVLVAFPPVRDPSPNANHSAEGRPEVVTWITQQTTPIYEESTANLVEDENLDNKVHKFVEKIVQSLQGNFEDLEHVLIDGQSTPNVTVSQYAPPVKRPSTTTKKPTRRPTKKPTYTGSTTRPKPTVPLITRPPPRPTTTKRPASYTPTKRPLPTTTIFLEDTNQYSPSSSEHTVSIPSSTYLPPSEVDYKRECGVRPLLKNGRIVGGKGATFGEWPWQVLVREATWLGLFTKNKCGGVLITSKYVITAAHCQPGFLASLIAVFGEYDISGELESKRSVSRPVKRVIVHRLYNAATFENDIALLELDTPVQFDQHIVPICMPRDDEDFTGRVATVTGWGRLKYGGGVPSVLQEVQVPVMENSVCQEMFHTAGHTKNILTSFICAGYANGQRDSCEGDSGGPLMIERPDGHWVLAGTVSHGIKCAAPYLPGVYMRTTYYKPWLQTITGVKDS